MAAKKKKKKKGQPSPAPDSPPSAADEVEEVASAESAEADAIEHGEPTSALVALGIPGEYSQDKSVAELETAYQLFRNGDYPSSRTKLRDILASKDVPKPVRDGAETFVTTLDIDTTSLITALVLAAFLLLVLALAY